MIHQLFCERKEAQQLFLTVAQTCQRQRWLKNIQHLQDILCIRMWNRNMISCISYRWRISIGVTSLRVLSCTGLAWETPKLQPSRNLVSAAYVKLASMSLADHLQDRIRSCRCRPSFAGHWPYNCRSHGSVIPGCARCNMCQKTLPCGEPGKQQTFHQLAMHELITRRKWTVHWLYFDAPPPMIHGGGVRASIPCPQCVLATSSIDITPRGCDKSIERWIMAKSCRHGKATQGYIIPAFPRQSSLQPQKSNQKMAWLSLPIEATLATWKKIHQPGRPKWAPFFRATPLTLHCGIQTPRQTTGLPASVMTHTVLYRFLNKRDLKTSSAFPSSVHVMDSLQAKDAAAATLSPGTA